MDLFNGTKRYIFTPTFGYDETGIWIGNSGNLINDHADIAIAPFFVTLQRLHALDYLVTILPTHGYFVFRAPQLSSVANLYTLPFSRMVWICFGILVLVCLLAIYVLMRAERSSHTSLSDVMLLIVGAICQMSTDLNARFNAGRLMTVRPIIIIIILCAATSFEQIFNFYSLQFFFFLTFVFVYTSFTASIVGILQSSTKSIKTLTDLYQSKLQLAVEDTVYNRYYFGVR